MDYSTFRPDHIEDVLVRMHDGQWFGWSNSKNKIYENLIILDNTKTKPTEKSLTDALAKQQNDFDALEYSRNRAKQYPELAEQLDLLWHAIDTGTLDNRDHRNKFYSMLKQVKENNPKG